METAFGYMSFTSLANVAAQASSHEGSKQTLLDFTPTFIIVIINLLILYFILNKLLFSRLTDHMDKRAKGIESSLLDAENAKLYAKDVVNEYNEKLKQINEHIAKMTEEARVSATLDAEQIIKQAKNEATLLISKAKEDIEREHERMIKDIRGEVASLALAAASKVIEANLDNERNRKLVEKFIDEVGVA
jgi:F-type H+-transporting ATPase subunit b